MLDDARGQSIQIGAVLLFGVLLITFAFVQAVLVPDANAEVEFSHSQTVQGQMQELRTGVLRAAATGNSYPATVDLGLRYPTRFLLANPGPTSGTLRTVERPVISVDNVTAIDPEAADFYARLGPNNDRNNVTYETRAIRYDIDYSVYRSNPTTVYESSVVYERYVNTNRTVTGQSVVDGRRISLVALNGSLSASSTAARTVDLVAASAAARTVAVTNTDGNRFRVRVPARLTRSELATLFADQIDGSGDTTNGAYVHRIRCSGGSTGPCGVLTLVFEQGVTYNLRMAEVGLGSGRTPAHAYTTVVAGNGTTVAESGSQLLVVEARDRYGNPVSGVRMAVDLQRLSGNPLDSANVTTVRAVTDGDGRATFRFEAPDEVRRSPSQPNTAEYEVAVGPSGAGCRAGQNDLTDPLCTEIRVFVQEVDGDAS